MGWTRLMLCLAAAAVLLGGCAGRTSGPAGGSHGMYKVGDPYQINGTWYYPAEDWSYDETGIASWYGEEFHGRYTADGELYDLNALTAAHRTLPMPSIVQVTNLENGRSIEVRVNDRGPFARGRIIDLSRRAAQLLGFEAQGTAKVRVKILVPESIQVASLAGRTGPAPMVAGVQPQPAPVDKVATEALPTPAGVRVAAAPLPVPSRPPAPPPMPSVTAAPAIPEKVTVVPVRPSQIYIQAGAFASVDRAWRLKQQLEKLGPVSVTDARANGLMLYRVRVGPVATVEQADGLLDKVSVTSPDARIVVN
ncbi:MAG TPA: septal ring lytic transglycosylase RlpA family protein [Stellaceae bacterium]|nr:septal ring lytic transglycosylase RlpA family protein [Stellaceae bacterium]